jgi:hypothetical protein
MVAVAVAAALLAVVAPALRPRPLHPPGTWFGDGPFLTLWMPDGSTVVATPETRDRVLADFVAQTERYYGVGTLPPGLPTDWTPNRVPKRTRPAAKSASGDL